MMVRMMHNPVISDITAVANSLCPVGSVNSNAIYSGFSTHRIRQITTGSAARITAVAFASDANSAERLADAARRCARALDIRVVSALNHGAEITDLDPPDA